MMKADYSCLLEQMKQYRAHAVDFLDFDPSRENAQHLAYTHMAVLAIEAVMAEPEPVKTGPMIEFGEDGYPKE